MRQKQRKAEERADAEAGRVLEAVCWAQGKESCDCHPVRDGELLTQKDCPGAEIPIQPLFLISQESSSYEIKNALTGYASLITLAEEYYIENT